MNWLEVSMTVDGELAESVADVFARFAPNGVMTEQGVKYNDAEDAGTPTGPITDLTGLKISAGNKSIEWRSSSKNKCDRALEPGERKRSARRCS